MTRNPFAPPADAKVDWYKMQAKEENTADVYIYDAIGGWFGVDASQFVQDLAALDVENINLWVNSPGGSVFDGVAIMNALRRHKATVTATVDGIAASAASFIIQAADEVVMGRGAEMMIHDAWGICLGNAADMGKMAEDLNRLSGTIASLYAERAGGTEDEWRQAMRDETWYTAAEAVEAGLADRVDGNSKDDKDAANRFDLSIFAHAGRRNAPPPNVPSDHTRRPGLSLANGSALPTVTQVAAQATTKPPAEPVEITNPPQEGTDTMSDTLNQGLRERLGISAEAELDDDGLLSAVDEALAEQEPSTPPAPAEGTVVLDEEQYQDLQAAAAEGRAARRHQLTADREALVNAAIDDGRIAPGRRDHWLNTLEADPGMADTLARLEKGLVPLKAKGYTGGVDEASDEDDTYSKVWGSAETKEA